MKIMLSKVFKGSPPSLRKLLKWLLLLLIPVFVGAMIIIVYTFYIGDANYKQRTESTLDFQLQQLDSELSNINYFMVNTLTYNKNAQRLAEDLTPYEIYYYSTQIQNDLSAAQVFIDEGFNFVFMNPERDLVVSGTNASTDYGQKTRVLDYLWDQVIPHYTNQGTRSPWNLYEIEGNTYLAQIYQYRALYVCCWIRTDRLFSFFQSIGVSDNSFYTLLDQELNPLTPAESLEDYLPDLVNGDICYTKGSMFVYLSSPTRMNLRLLFVDKKDYLFESAGFYTGVLAVIFVVVIGFCGYTLYYFRHYIMGPLQHFKHHVHLYEQQRMRKKVRGFAELNEATEIFDSLIQQMEVLKIDMYEERIARTRTELDYFQLQIKPHFFVNCFSIIFGMAQSQKYEAIQELCLKLSSYVRHLFVNSFDLVPLEDELTHIREYLEIQNIRFKTAIQLDLSADDPVNYRIPPLILLTLVENSVKHNKFQENLRIAISACDDGCGNVVLSVSDNGIGAGPETLAALNNRVFEASREEQVGIKNILRRLELIYGESFSIEFSNLPGTEGGFHILITLPHAETQH